MNLTISRFAALALVACWTCSSVRAQQPPPAPQPPARPSAQPPAGQPLANANQPQADPRIHVQARGEVHEAFAQPFQAVVKPTSIIHKQPPAPITEEPPAERPAGKNVQWVPGYWQWDSDRNDFSWISGIWRDQPEERHWVVGYWTQLADGWYRVRGHWAAQQETDYQYVDKPPEPRDEQQPAAPDADSLWIPGGWFYTDSGWQWRPGYYTAQRPGYVWQPASYYYSPNGYGYNSGYWDYDPANRGLMFAPVYFDQPLWQTQGWTFRPLYALNTALLWTSLFIWPGYGYYWGNWYGPHYAGMGFQPWYAYGGARYDPLYAYQTWNFRNDPNWMANIRSVNQARIAGTAALPPRTIIATGAAGQQSLVAPLNQLRASSNVKLQAVTPQERTAIMQSAQTMHQHATEFHQGRFPANVTTNLKQHPSTSTSFHPGAFQQGNMPQGAPRGQPQGALKGQPQGPPKGQQGPPPHNPGPPAGGHHEGGKEGGGKEGKK